MLSTESISINQYRTHTCGELTKDALGTEVRLSGWVQTRRDHGGLIFIDLRDKWGVTQLTLDPSKQPQAWSIAESLRSEYVISVQGTVVARPKDMVNQKLTTGEIEIEVASIDILSTSETPPFEVATDGDIGEDIRLQYRFLDLRHPRMQERLKLRDAFIMFVRE